MFKKLHVGEFIKEYMDVLGYNDTSLSRVSGVSRDHIINIKNGMNDLSAQTAINLAPFLQVKAEFLMSLQVSYMKYLEEKSFKEKHHKVFDSISPEFEMLVEKSRLSSKTFDLFSKSEKAYCDNLSIFYYQPNKADTLKNYLLIESLNSFEVNFNSVSKSSLANYIESDYFNSLLKVKTQKQAQSFLKKTENDLYELGITLKIMQTGLKTTIKGISKQTGNSINVLVENTGNFGEVVWYLTHELSHILIDEEEIDSKYLEESVDYLTKKILLRDYADALSALHETDIDEIDDVNQVILEGCWNFTNKKYWIKSKREIKLEVENDFHTQLQ